MIRHQTLCENIDAEAVQFFGHKIEVRFSIAVSLEDRNRSYTSLRDVMRILRNYHSGNTRLAQTLVEPDVFSQEKLVLCPRNPIAATAGYI